MTGTTESLLLAVACFVGGHFIFSSLAVRIRLIRLFGENGFRAGYSLVALGTLIWSIMAYRAAPHLPLWDNAALVHIAIVLMPLACILVVTGLTSRSVTMIGGENMANDPHIVGGITTVTRHPFLWGVSLWAIAHLAASGDSAGAGLILFGGIGLLALGGMVHIDYRRNVMLGADWGPIAMTTSAIPFLAALQGRAAIDWRGIGWPRVGLGLGLYLLLPFLHPWIAGVPIVPDFSPGLWQ